MVYKIGIVDDEPEVAQTLTDMLTRYKEDKNSDGGGVQLEFNIRAYASGEEFLNDSPCNFDIVFLDINMPGANGGDKCLHALRAVRRKGVRGERCRVSRKADRRARVQAQSRPNVRDDKESTIAQDTH